MDSPVRLLPLGKASRSYLEAPGAETMEGACTIQPCRLLSQSDFRGAHRHTRSITLALGLSAAAFLPRQACRMDFTPQTLIEGNTGSPPMTSHSTATVRTRLGSRGPLPGTTSTTPSRTRRMWPQPTRAPSRVLPSAARGRWAWGQPAVVLAPPRESLAGGIRWLPRMRSLRVRPERPSTCNPEHLMEDLTDIVYHIVYHTACLFPLNIVSYPCVGV
eukprot:Rmarinus@m.6042